MESLRLREWRHTYLMTFKQYIAHKIDQLFTFTKDSSILLRLQEKDERIYQKKTNQGSFK